MVTGDNNALLQDFLKKLRRSKITLASLLFIFTMALLSVFAYLVVPDNTPDANDQLPDFALKRAGTSGMVLTMKSNGMNAGEGSWWSGYPKNHIEQPFDSIVFQDDAMLLTINGRKKPILYQQVLPENLLSKTREEKSREINQNYISKKTFWLGTDRYGRSVLSRLILGIRVSMMAGLLAVIVSLLLGVTLGALGGYFGGWVDNVTMYLVNVTWAVPTLLMVFAIVLALGRGSEAIFLAIGLTMWVDVARIVRGQVKESKEILYVTAAKAIGQKELAIIFRHILPNITGPVLVVTAANFATAILIEAGLSYLGFGINPPTPSLGNMLNENYGYALSGNVIIALAPAIMVSLLVLAFNLLGSGLRDIMDVKEEKH